MLEITTRVIATGLVAGICCFLFVKLDRYIRRRHLKKLMESKYNIDDFV